MTKEQFRREMAFLKRRAYLDIRNSSPILTGNLQNSVRIRDLEDGGFEIYIDTIQAPYAQFTLEKWTHPRWKSKPNPNEGWAYEATRQFLDFATNRLTGGGK